MFYAAGEAKTVHGECSAGGVYGYGSHQLKPVPSITFVWCFVLYIIYCEKCKIMMLK